ncbi:hypothetical protein MTBPR1_100075 [Candidatus Terasakiella magnetica]|uniref:Uncharacterized protein n=1 Tax=Candidatus Terasakiella magnetica TaxID=1867952 RepID=A0A1C3RDZ3_9PROT|nr:hypothetical protein [Candidatus Terasakiella magnetica]SCA55434.1 hypothetical protein MTBPR1_100075 [Candidatus Terasakiella magnetica]
MEPFTIFMMVANAARTMIAARQQQKAAQKAAQQAADQHSKEQWEAYEKAEKERKDRLKKGLAKKRARMGASGFSSADGSACAIIQGMRTDAAEDTYEDFSQKKESVDNKISSLHSNLLEQSDQTKRAMFRQAASTAGTLAGGFFDKEEVVDENGNKVKKKGNYSDEGRQIGELIGGFV